MCTLTWWREGSGSGSFGVFFNRDEKKTRPVAEPPCRHRADGVEFLSPRDPEGGGTWMFVNARGLVVCLLNRWHETGPTPRNPVKSRGMLVWEMAGLDYVPAAGEALRRADLATVRPFTLVAFDRTGEEGWDWNGEVLSRASLEFPITTSSFHSAEVTSSRKARFDQLRRGGRADRELLESFHADDEGGPSASTVRMNRPDAQTMSRSCIKVGPKAADWTYLEEAPGLAGSPRQSACSLDMH